MLKLERSEPHPDFLPDAGSEIDRARTKVEETILAGKKLAFPEHWRQIKYKQILMQAQHGKCGFCEHKIRPGQTGDVEHFAPKSEISTLVERGKEVEGLSNVRGRKVRVVSDVGYWWLAYDWSNYLIACMRCNQVWKGSLFPVHEEPRRLPPSPDVSEEPLLLSPFGVHDPVEHLRFDELGQIRSGSEHGKATIEVCGLDRESLREARQEKAELIWDLILDLATSAGSQRSLRRILRAGREDADHAGMVRCIIKAQLDLDWFELETAVDMGYASTPD
jgi:hypothetical protein